MPEPDNQQAGHAAQTDEHASAPVHASEAGLDKPTTTKTEQKAEQPSAPSNGLMEFLDIPKEVQSQIAPKGEEPRAPTKPGPEEEEAGEEAPPAKTEDEDEEEDEKEQETEPAAAEGEHKPDKRDKRIKRLTRQKWEAERQVDSLLSQTKELEQRLQQFQGAPAAEAALPISGSRLGYITDERKLNQEVAKAEAIIEWCDANPDGATTGEGGTEKFIAPEEIAKWRRLSERTVLSAPNRREEIRGFQGARSHYDSLAQQVWPELFDNKSADYQLAQAVLSEFPAVKASPQANYAVGLVLEGAKALDARVKANGSKPPAKAHRDISERAFEPRVPIAPHTPEPPTREAVPSSQKRLTEAMSNLVKDTDGSQSSLANVFAALSDADRTRPRSRAPVRS